MASEFFRNELKYLISEPDSRLLRARLSAVFAKDPHAQPDGSYLIRSLYFDDMQSSAFFDKIAGIADREKFRIRYYNGSPSFIQLEKKEKVGNMIRKTGERIPAGLAERIACGEGDLLLDSEKPLLREFALRVKNDRLKPILFVDYVCAAFFHPAGNLRITIDEALTASPFRFSLFDPATPAYPALERGRVILEVKYDDVLLPLARDLIADIPAESVAVSKYCKCVELLF